MKLFTFLILGCIFSVIAAVPVGQEVAKIDEEVLKGWLSSAWNAINKPISISGVNIGISPLNLVTAVLLPRGSDKYELSEEAFKGWLSNAWSAINKPISIGGVSLGISGLDIATIVLLPRLLELEAEVLQKSLLSEEAFRGWLSSAWNTINKPITIGGVSLGVSGTNLAVGTLLG